jgi:hypothetical protein
MCLKRLKSALRLLRKPEIEKARNPKIKPQLRKVSREKERQDAWLKLQLEDESPL